MIVIIGESNDLCSKQVASELRNRGRNVVEITEASLFPTLCAELEISGQMDISAVRSARTSIVNGSEIEAALIRATAIASELRCAPTDAEYIRTEWEAFVRGWTHSIRGNVINRLRPEFWSRRYLDSSRLSHFLEPSGTLEMLRSIRSNDIQELAQFLNRCNEGAVLELTADSAHWFVSETDLHTLDELAARFIICLREFSAGESESVIVVANQALASAPGISTTTLDECIRLCERMGLVFMKANLLKKGSSTYCIGVDLVPDISDFEEPLRREVIRLLADTLMP